MEAEHEIHGLSFWCGDPTVRLLRADGDFGVMLLERCKPGTTLRVLEESEQDVVISSLLRRLWHLPLTPHPFHPLRSVGFEVANSRGEWTETKQPISGSAICLCRNRNSMLR